MVVHILMLKKPILTMAGALHRSCHREGWAAAWISAEANTAGRCRDVFVSLPTDSGKSLQPLMLLGLLSPL